MFSELSQLSSSQLPIPLLDAFVAIVLAFGLSAGVRTLYQRLSPRESQDPHFDTVLWFLAPILTVVMMLIGSNLALSIGMVGSLSIIRFRNVIRSSRDMVFIFWLIALGLGCGTFSYKLTILAFLAIAGILYVMTPKLGGPRRRGHELVLRGEGSFDARPIQERLQQSSKDFRLINVLETRQGWEALYALSSLEDPATVLESVRSLGLGHVAIHEAP